MTFDVGADESQTGAGCGRNAEVDARPPSAQSRTSEDPGKFEFRFEFERTMAALGTDPQLARQLLLSFYTRHAQSPLAVRDALQASEWEEAERIVHNLKGTAGTVGFHAISAVAEQLEAALRDQPVGDLQSLLTQLEQTCKPVFDELASLSSPVGAPASEVQSDRPTLGDDALRSELAALQSRIESMDPDTAEILDRLLPSLLARGLSSPAEGLRSALEQFDFQSAESHLHALRTHLGDGS